MHLTTLTLTVIYQFFTVWVLFLKKFRGKQAIPSLIDLSPLIKIRLRFLQQSQVQPSKVRLINLQLDFN